MFARTHAVVVLVGLCSAVACRATAEAPQVDLDALDAVVRQAAPRDLGRPFPALWTCGHPTEDQVQAMAMLGMATFVSLRAATEEGSGWEEEWAARSGVAFVRVPVTGAVDVDYAHARSLDAVLNSASGGPILLYCGSSNRVGALLALRAHGLQGVPVSEAIALGERAGLKGLLPRVREVIEP